jgi:hypothetical protein
MNASITLTPDVGSAYDLAERLPDSTAPLLMQAAVNMGGFIESERQRLRDALMQFPVDRVFDALRGTISVEICEREGLKLRACTALTHDLIVINAPYYQPGVYMFEGGYYDVNSQKSFLNRYQVTFERLLSDVGLRKGPPRTTAIMACRKDLPPRLLEMFDRTGYFAPCRRCGRAVYLPGYNSPKICPQCAQGE